MLIVIVNCYKLIFWYKLLILIYYFLIHGEIKLTYFPAGKYWSPGTPLPTSSGLPLKILFARRGDIPIWRPREVSIWRPGDVLKWRPGDVLIWRSRDVRGRLIRDVPKTFSGRPLEDIESTQTWMSKFFGCQNLLDWPNLKAFQHSRYIENPVKLLRWSIFCKIS